MEAVLATGVTCLLPTVITATEAALFERFAALDRAVSDSALGRAMCPGYHPFLNPGAGYAGCHPAAAMTAPDWDLVVRLERGLARPILLITLAPELAGAEAFVRAARAAGKLVAIGHSAVDFATARAAAEWGVGLSTHLGNGLPHTLPKFVNPLMAQLAEDRLSTCFIADGIHIPADVLKVLIRAAGPERALLVTDAVSAAAAEPGLFGFAGMTIERDAGGAVRLPGLPGLAGSALCLDQAARNLVAWGIASADDALAMAGERPMRRLAPALSAHGIVVPESLVVWSDRLMPLEVRVGGVQRSFRDPPLSQEPHDDR